MADLAPTQSAPSPATDADGNLLLSREDAQALLRECFAEFKTGLIALVHVSIETTNDLFENNAFVGEAEVADFRSKRGEWIERFGQALTDLFERRLAGTRRQGRRPDFDASLTTLRVLNTFDHEKQASLTTSTQFLYRLTKRELDAIDLRVGALLGESRMRDVDNPFSPDYVLDAIGLSSRALYPNPRVWRPLMERLLSDVTLGINKSFIKVNRFLADHQVLPEIKAQLRARSELRPRDDAELLPTFLRLFKEGRSAAADELLALGIAVPAASAATSTALKDLPKAEAPRAAPGSTPAGGAPQAEPAPAGPYGPPTVAPAPSAIDSGPATALAAALNPYIADLARALQSPEATRTPATDMSGLPQVDPLMAIGSLSAAVAVLDRWQRLDPGSDHQAAEASSSDAASRAAAMNRIPFIRAAIDDKVVSSTDKITMDVIGLLFDYIFRDPSIPEELRSLFTRLQVPILKTALLDRSFFSDRKHPARRLLDHLAGAAIGATGDAGYRAAFELTSAGVIEEVCHDFQVDVGVFDVADRKVQEFVDAELQKGASALGTEVAAALAAEEGEADRSAVRALIRDKLSGLDVPFDVRSFSETIWADYLTNVRLAQGTEGDEWRRGVRTLDDLLWSLTAKERSAQKARLAKLVPGMIRNLRAGAAAVNVGDERVKPLLDAMYQLHMAAIKPAGAASADDARAPDPAAAATSAASAEAATPVGSAAPAPRIANVHDFVAEMVVGTWLAFGRGDKTVNARLSWISPMRSKYLFTTRERSRAIVATPEDLAWQLGAGKATLIVEPVPLFDRAVSAALDTLAAQKPHGDAVAAA